jgi:hypothetical protein
MIAPARFENGCIFIVINDINKLDNKLLKFYHSG